MVSSSNYQELFLSSTKMRKKVAGFPKPFCGLFEVVLPLPGPNLTMESTGVAYRTGFSDNWPAFWAYLLCEMVRTIWKIWIWRFHDVSDFSVKHPEMMQSWPRRMRSVSCFAKMSSFKQEFSIAKRNMAKCAVSRWLLQLCHDTLAQLVLWNFCDTPVILWNYLYSLQP